MQRVYVTDGSIWILASRYAELGPLPAEADRYLVLPTIRPPSAEVICTVTDDGRRLCDIGPQHEHERYPDDISEVEDRQHRLAEREAMRGN